MEGTHESWAIHDSGAAGANRSAPAPPRGNVASSGGCANAQNPNFSIMGQLQEREEGGPAWPVLEANLQGGGGLYVERIVV
jgi:hypothetical protein